jgi:hypothetical protein
MERRKSMKSDGAVALAALGISNRKADSFEFAAPITGNSGKFEPVENVPENLVGEAFPYESTATPAPSTI